jgi:competence protein ComEA
MKNPFDSLITPNEQKILGYLGALIIAGFIISYSGLSSIYAQKQDTEMENLKQATVKDSLILIDIRTADPEDLVLLPGIGEKRAADIIAYRKSKQFVSTEELLNIKGIGAKTFLAMKPMLLKFGNSGQDVESQQKLAELRSTEAFSRKSLADSDKPLLDGSSIPPKTESGKTVNSPKQEDKQVKLNSATLEDLISLEGIGDKKAAAILTYRKQLGGFTSVEQLLDVKGIGPKTLDKNRRRLSL